MLELRVGEGSKNINIFIYLGGMCEIEKLISCCVTFSVHSPLPLIMVSFFLFFCGVYLTCCLLCIGLVKAARATQTWKYFLFS